MAVSSTTGTGESSDPAQESRSAAQAEIDLQALAKKVYQLLREEARLERERLGHRHAW